MPPTNPQISLVPDSDPETTDTEPSTEWSSSMGMWCTSTKLVYRAMQAVEHQVKAEKKDFAERLGEATKACNAELEGEVPGKLDPLKKWAARVVGYHSTWRKTLDEKAAALGKRKQQLADLKAAFAELMDANPQSEQLGLSFGAEKNGGPGWADSTISIVNGLARAEVQAANGNAPEPIRALVAALANYSATTIDMPTATAEPDEAPAAEGDDISGMFEAGDGEAVEAGDGEAGDGEAAGGTSDDGDDEDEEDVPF